MYNLIYRLIKIEESNNHNIAINQNVIKLEQKLLILIQILNRVKIVNSERAEYGYDAFV